MAASTNLELQRASSASDLWQVIEAGQYAHVFLDRSQVTEVTAEVVAAFFEGLNATIEAWDTDRLVNKAPLLSALQFRLNALADNRLSAYWGITHRRFETVSGSTIDLPVAIVRVDREKGCVLQTPMPALLDEFDVTADDRSVR